MQEEYIPGNCGSKNGKAKLNESKVREIRALLSGGMKRRQVAERFGCSWSAIRDIDKQLCWNHVR